MQTDKLSAEGGTGTSGQRRRTKTRGEGTKVESHDVGLKHSRTTQRGRDTTG